MIIQHNISAINSYRNLGINQDGLSKNLEKLSSGYRINRAGDDAAGLAISENMRRQIGGLDQAATNAKDAIGLIQTAEGALTETHSMLQRLNVLATQAANGIYNTTAYGNIKSEVDQLNAEITRISSSCDFNGIKPFSADAANGMTFQIGPSSTETLKVDKKIMTASALSITACVYTSVTSANSALTKIEAAINTVASHRAKLGAAQNRLEHTVNNLKVTSENISAAESRIRDTDMASEITSFTKNNILLQAAQSMLTQANAAPQGVLSMLQ